MSGKTGTAAAPNANQPLATVTMTARKETKSTVVYDGPPALPTLYVPKLVVGTPHPAKINVTVTKAD